MIIYFDDYSSDLFNDYKDEDKRTAFTNLFNNHINSLDLLRKFNLGLVSSDKKLDLVTFYSQNARANDNEINRGLIDANKRNNVLFKDSIRNNDDFNPVNKDNQNIRVTEGSNYELFQKISNQCRNNVDCKRLFNNNFNTQYIH